MPGEAVLWCQLLRQLDLLHMLPISLFQLERNWLQIVCIPDSSPSGWPQVSPGALSEASGGTIHTCYSGAYFYILLCSN